METVIPRNSPDSQSMTQGQIVKKPVLERTVKNAEGNESGESTTAGLGTTTGQQSTAVDYQVRDVNQRNATKQPYINISASEENRAAKFKYPTVTEAIPEAGRNQYQ